MKKLHLYFVLGGAVSAGAYTAGVIDYFMLCLKNYMSDSNNNRDWDIQVKAIAGTSAGGMCGSIFLHNLAFGYPGLPENSVLHKTWVNDIDIGLLSETDDLSGSHPTSLLNGKVLKELADGIFKQTPDSSQFKSVPFLANDCKLLLSVTDTVGKSYKIDFINDSSEKPYFITNHRDYYRYALSNPSGHDTELNNRQSWDKLKEVSVATGAFPIGLPPVMLKRPSENVFNDIEINGEILKPFNVKNDTHQYWAIDGGIGDNEPFGQLGKIIEENNDDAENAVIFIDPFPSENTEEGEDDLKSQFSRLYKSLRDQSAYKPNEIIKFSEKKFKCYSIIPKRSNDPEIKNHLAGSFLGAFSGFIHKKFRHYDYQLGMRNCQRFIDNYFDILKDSGSDEEVPPLPWPSITKKEFNNRTKALDKRIILITKKLLKASKKAFLARIIVKRILKPSKNIGAILENNKLVTK